MRKYFDRLYGKTSDKFYKELESNLKNNKKEFIITANPETFMKATNDEEMDKMLLDKNSTLIPDGIGIVKAAKILDYDIKERIPGIDIANKLLELGNKHKKSIYLFGAKEEVITSLCEVITNTYPNFKIVGAKNGYEKDRNKVFKDIIKKEPDIVLVALGIPEQEKLIYKYLDKFKKGIFVGVGGSFDVMSGHKKRAPKVFQKLNLEWLYRIVKEPKRLKRFYDSNVKFMFIINKIKNQNLSLREKIVNILTKLFFLCYFVFSVYWLYTIVNHDLIRFLKYALFICVILALIKLILNKVNIKINKKILIPILIIITILLRLQLLLFDYVTPKSDYATFYYNAISIANNQPENFATRYISASPYLYGYIWVLGIFMKLFGTTYINVVILNIMLDIIGGGIFYLFSKNLFNKNQAIISLIVWLFNPFQIYFSIICSPVVIVNTFIALSLYITSLFIKNINNIKLCVIYGIILGIVLSISNYFRPIMIILIIAIFIYLIYLCIAKELKIKNFVVGFLLVFSFYQLGNTLYYKSVSNATGYKINKSLPGWSIYVGSNKNAIGQWNIEDAQIFNEYINSKDYVPEKFSDRFKKMGLERYKNNGIKSDIRLLIDKSKIFGAKTNEYLYSSFISDTKVNVNFIKQLAVKSSNIFWYMMTILNLIISIMLFKIKRTNKMILYCLLIIGLYASSLLVEVSPRYFFPLIVPLSFMMSVSLGKIYKLNN